MVLKKYLIICMETSVFHIKGFKSDNDIDSTHKCRLKSHTCIHSSRAINISLNIVIIVDEEAQIFSI